MLGARLVQDVLERRQSAEAALAAWPSASNATSSPLAKAWTRLRHFADDEDLHRADPGYLAFEQERLHACVSELRQDAEPH